MKITQYLKLIFLPFFLIPQWCSRGQLSLWISKDYRLGSSNLFFLREINSMGYYSVRCCYDMWYLYLLWQRFKTHKFFEFSSVYEEGTRRPDLTWSLPHKQARFIRLCGEGRPWRYGRHKTYNNTHKNNIVLLAGYSFSCSLGYINRGMQDMEIRAFCEFTNFFITLTSLFSYIDFSFWSFAVII